MTFEESKERALALFNYLKQLSTLKQNIVTDIHSHSWSLYLKDLLFDEDNITISYRDRTDEEEDLQSSYALLAVKKPEHQKCPEPPQQIKEWLLPDWDNFRIDNARVREYIRAGYTEIMFNDSEERAECLQAWSEQRKKWVKEQRKIEKTRDLFSNLYKLYVEANRDSESMELIVANGFIEERDNDSLCHPILTKRVGIKFDSLNNVISLVDLDVDPELYTSPFQVISDIDLTNLPELVKELRDNDYHPMDRNETPAYLKKIIYQLSSESCFSATVPNADWKTNNRFIIYGDPVFIFRKRLDGTARFLEAIINSLDTTDWLPGPICDAVSGGKVDVPEEDHELTIEELLAQVGGEDAEILLSKEANREQLDIARRINNYNAVLVQGPPGTGKTHTIANLMGHFLAQGKSILVTSQTSKALTVLKEKLPKNLRALCVSVLDDRNLDMEKSVDDITAFIGSHTAGDLLRKAEQVREERSVVIKDLGETRRKIYSIIKQEANNLVINGEEISPSKAAEFIVENQDNLSYIPGRVDPQSPLPLTYQELIRLYRSNENISPYVEKELACDIPSTEEILSVEEFSDLVERFKTGNAKLDLLKQETGWAVRNDLANGTVITIEGKEILIPFPSKDTLEEVIEYINDFGELEGWMKYAAIDGLKGGAYQNRWNILLEQIDKTCEAGEKFIGETFGKELTITNMEEAGSLKETYRKLAALFSSKGKVTKFDLFMDKSLQKALDCAKINGAAPISEKDCELIIQKIELTALRRQCDNYWKDLISRHGELSFLELDLEEPERIAKNWAATIRKNLNWYSTVLDDVENHISKVGIHIKDVIVVKRSDNGLVQTEKILDSIRNVIPKVLQICRYGTEQSEIRDAFTRTKAILKDGQRIGSAICSQLVDAIDNLEPEAYKTAFKNLETLFEKYEAQKTRSEYLDRLSGAAPDWAEAIKNRSGIHGESEVPLTVEDAYRWKQYSAVISDLIKISYDELQSESVALGKKYRELTGKYAELMAWYHLLHRTENDLDMRQALIGWRLTVRKIGKGTGKSAPKLKAEARKLMVKCQDAVPAWIMPVNKIMEGLDPARNRFDVMIIDEASQSDITAIGLMYLARKVIIVGDDKQVSPMAIGTSQDKMDALSNLIRDVIPNSHLYTPTTSLYDIAATTYHPLMLKEHFRCVPDIIGFSNMLSYDYQIRPLRDAGGSKLLPAVINYRVDGGERCRMHNEQEARTIIALLKACMKQPEYAKKTYGIISLLGDDQARLISKYIYKYIDIDDIDRHKILCGNPAHFQGDERDVIFLSMVDSNESDGPLSLTGFGPGESTRKRYNVAASRAKDQLWVVDSLDKENDLKAGDIRKTLIEYSQDPKAFRLKADEIESKAESPFEAEVAQALTLRGFKLVQQWEVGAYRIDMVAVSGNNHIAIECDGEKFHSGEAKLREDMERQTILERSGWKFIRIRGSEYYRNKTQTIDRVISELHANSIEPSVEYNTEQSKDTDLLARIRADAALIKKQIDEDIESPKEIPYEDLVAAYKR